jgi:hypothetical protein
MAGDGTILTKAGIAAGDKKCTCPDLPGQEMVFVFMQATQRLIRER